MIEELYRKRVWEIERFFLFLINNNIEYQLNIVILFSYLPFRDSKNMFDEIRELSKYKNYKECDYFSFILRTYYEYNPNNINIAFEKLKSFVDKVKFNPLNFNTDWRLGNNTKLITTDFNTSMQEFIDTYNLQTDERKQKVGQFAEHLVYKRYIEDTENYKVLWISKELGDGFGYDMIVHDLKNDKYIMIEVKGVTSRIEAILSKNESETFYKIKNNNLNEDYHIVIVPLSYYNGNIDYDIINVYYENENLKHDSYKNKSYIQIVPLEEDRYKRIELINGRL